MTDEPKFKILSGGVPLPSDKPEPEPDPNAPVELAPGVTFYPMDLRLEVNLDHTGGERTHVEFVYAAVANEHAPALARMIARIGKDQILAADPAAARRALIAAGSRWGIGVGGVGDSSVYLYSLRDNGSRWEAIAKFGGFTSGGTKLDAAYVLGGLLDGRDVPTGPVEIAGQFEIKSVPKLRERRAHGAIFTKAPTVVEGPLPDSLVVNMGLLMRRLGSSSHAASHAEEVA
ncbi:MAG: hypothetical protein K8H90_07850 [Thermoanaerobaculia bacterium]|nr:hypothetical protein [Thermoanaerobaculia bacterium]